jgi:hypothetical protein
VVPEQTFKAWEHQHTLAARSRSMAETRTRQMVVEARIRLEKAMRALETSAAMESDDVT